MAMVLVGATIVGKIGTSWQGDLPRSRGQSQLPLPQNQPLTLQKASEMGYFKLGSTVVLLFADGSRVNWQLELQAGHKIRYGQAFGTASNNV